MNIWLIFQVTTISIYAQINEPQADTQPTDSVFVSNEKITVAISAFEQAVIEKANTREILKAGIESAYKALAKNDLAEADSIIAYCLKLTDINQYPDEQIQILFLSGKLELQKHNSELAIEKLTQTLDLSVSQNNIELLGDIYNNIGIAYWYLRNYPQALDFFDDALDFAEKHSNESLRLKALTNKGIVYGQYANYKKAIECLLLANELAYKSNEKSIEASSLNSLGNVYMQTKQYIKALNSYEEAKKIYHSLSDSSGISVCLNNIGEVYLIQNNPKLALENYFSSLAIQEKRKDTINIASIYVNIGNTHSKDNQYRYAIKFYQDALELITKKKDQSLEAEIKYQLGMSMMAIGNNQASEDYFSQASLIANQLGEKELLSKSLLALSQVYEKQSKFKEALSLKNEYATLKDTILSEKTIEYMARMDAIYRSIQKEKTISDLQAENRRQEQNLEKEKNSRMIFLIISIFLALLIVILFAAYQIKQRSNRKMAEVNKKLQQLNATKDKFFSIISHDLKSPINSILGFSEMLVLHAETGNTKNLLDYSQMVHSSSKKLYALVDNLLHWSRTQVGSTKYSPEMLDISIQCNNIISLLRLSSEEKDILISGKIEREVMAYADINLFNTILRNLISNAIKFSRVGGTITVSAKKVGHFVEISVVDSGVGISSENLEKLFKIDTNFSTKGTFNEKGSGLGLVLCKEFVEINKGTIWAESELEKGSTFYFTVPLAKM